MTSSIVTVVLMLASVNAVFSQNANTEFERELQKNTCLYKSKAELLSFFKKEKEEKKSSVLDHFIEEYHAYFRNANVLMPTHRRRPFIVIEGNDYDYKTRVAMLVANWLNAQLLPRLPKTFHLMSYLFPKTNSLNPHYHALSLHTTALKVKKALAHDKIVIINGYWYGKASEIIAQAYKNVNDLPNKESVIYTPPYELLKPDLLLYLKHSPVNNTSASESLMIEKKCKIYERFLAPAGTIITCLDSVHATAREVCNVIKKMLGSEFDMSYSRSKHYEDMLKGEEKILFSLEKRQELPHYSSLLEAYKTCYDEKPNVVQTSYTNVPFIAIDGYDPKRMEELARLLERKMNGVYLPRIPRCLLNVTGTFKEDDFFNLSCEMLALYVNAFQAKAYLKAGTPVIMIGYWFRAAADTIAKINQFQKKPVPRYSVFYKPPLKLLNSHMLFYLNAYIEPSNSSRTLKELELLQIYKRFSYPRPNFINIGRYMKTASSNVLTLVTANGYQYGYKEIPLPSLVKEQVDISLKFFRNCKTITEALQCKMIHYNAKPIAHDILTKYNNCVNGSDVEVPKKRRPVFILIEGIPNGETYISALMLAEKLGAKFLRSVPNCMKISRDYKQFPITTDSYFGLLLYVLAFQIRQLLNSGIPVILNRYWPNYVQHSLQSLGEEPLPSTDRDIYEYPVDLMKPDIFFFLHRNHEVTKSSFRKKIEFYQKFKHPEPILMDNSNYEKTVDRMLQEMQKKLGRDFYVSPR